MAELKAEQVKTTTRPEVSEEELVYITIPSEDLYDNTHPGVRLIGGSIKQYKDGKWIDTGKAGSYLEFKAGETYEVPSFVAKEVQRILDVFDREDRRLLRPKADTRSLNQVNRGSLWAKGSVHTGEAFDKGLAAEKGHAYTVQSWSR